VNQTSCRRWTATWTWPAGRRYHACGGSVANAGPLAKGVLLPPHRPHRREAEDARGSGGDLRAGHRRHSRR
jgi:hypothetical protein